MIEKRLGHALLDGRQHQQAQLQAQLATMRPYNLKP